MNDDIEMILGSTSEGGCYIESLVRSQEMILNRISRTTSSSENLTQHNNAQLDKLHEVIMAELDLALMSAAKARSDLLKTIKDNVKPIGVI